MTTRLLTLITITLFLSSCRYISGEDGLIVGENGVFRPRDGYLEAQISPNMSIPDELDSYTIDQLFVIPELVGRNADVFEEIPLPKPIERRRQEGVVIQAFGGNRWIVIDATPSQVWPLVRDYWTQLQVVLDYENPIEGILETTWLEVDNDAETRNKYRMVIEPGLHAGYSEIYVTHLAMSRAEEVPIVLTWPEESDDVERQRQIMDSISQYLADRNDIYQASSASLLAGSIEAESKANIIPNPSGSQTLELRVDSSRAWVVVRTALNDAGVTISDENRDQAVLNVSFAGIVEEEDPPGFIGRIFNFGGNDSTAPEPISFTVRLLETDDVITVVTEALDSSDDAIRIGDELITLINNNIG